MAPGDKFGQIEIDQQDWRRFMGAVRRSTDAELPKRLGQANKKIGDRFISEWLHPKPDPLAVGANREQVRPSASKNQVLLRAGGKHRAAHSPQMQWGKRAVRPFQRGKPKRPYIRESVDRHEDEIRNAWLEAIAEAMDPAFYETEP